MELGAVRDAYAARSQEYIDQFDRDEGVHEVDAAFLRRHLGHVRGEVLDLGCGPGYWTAYLHGLGVRTTGVDVVPAFIAHARAVHQGPEFRLGAMQDVDVPQHGAAGVLSWFSTIHLAPEDLQTALDGFRRLLAPSGTLVLGFFASDDEVAAFDHAVLTAYRWPAAVLAERLGEAGFAEVERVQRTSADRPGRTYGAIAARAT